jgi:hypothetical protein
MGDSLVAENANTSEGVQVSLHPLPLLNISEHYTRVRIQSAASSTGSSVNPDAGVKGELEDWASHELLKLILFCFLARKSSAP